MDGQNLILSFTIIIAVIATALAFIKTKKHQVN